MCVRIAPWVRVRSMVRYTPMPYADPAVQREYQKQWVAARRQVWIDTNGPCVKCGSRDDLEVDHVDPAKKVSHRIWSWSRKRREVELARCQVLCGLCHKDKTRRQRDDAVPHGVNRYKGRHGCRCSICRAANSADQAARRAAYGRQAPRVGASDC